MKIAAELRLKHGLLYEAARKCGSVRELAEAIGIGYQTVIRWMNLRGCPTPGEYTQWYTAKVEMRLEEITGAVASELFPERLKEATKLFRDEPLKRVEFADMEPSALLAMAANAQERLTVEHPIDAAERSELSEKMQEVMQTLDWRSRVICRLRFHERLSLSETAECMGITAERVQQIEARAIGMLRQPFRSSKVVDFATDKPPDFQRLDREFKRRLNMSLKDRYRTEAVD